MKLLDKLIKLDLESRDKASEWTKTLTKEQHLQIINEMEISYQNFIKTYGEEAVIPGLKKAIGLSENSDIDVIEKAEKAYLEGLILKDELVAVLQFEGCTDWYIKYACLKTNK